jgi:SOS-response transcriptional repressor LexA
MDISQLSALLKDKTWTDAEREEFGRRLTASRLAAKSAGAEGDSVPKYPFAPAVIEDINQLYKIQRRTYYSHESGSRFPNSGPLILIYAYLFGVRPEYLLLREDTYTRTGTDALSVDQVREALGLEPPGDVDEPPRRRINQAIERLPVYASGVSDTLYIPRLTASDIRDLLTGQLNLSSFSGDRFPVPRHVAAGQMAFAFQIPQGDISMVGADSPPFFPGAYLVVDPERETAPGEYLLCLPVGAKNPLPRRLQSRFPYTPDAPRFPFKLVAASPYAEPIEVHSADDCAILGRIIYVGQSL